MQRRIFSQALTIEFQKVPVRKERKKEVKKN
jgi:hypothetical protein